jgi:flagellar assembly protein FliH
MLPETERKIQRMEYRPFPGGGAGQVARPAEEPEYAVSRIRELEKRAASLEERTAKLIRQVDEARREGMELGRTQELREQTLLMEKAADRLTETLGEFRAERDQYLGAVEHEVVRLALAIASRVLHREAQMDPLLLSGAVRVALGQLAETAETRLRVPAAEEELWAQMLRLMPNLALRPELVADERLRAGDAVLEAQTGSVDLGVRAQLEEIERGFFDLLESREGILGAVASGGITEKMPGNRE